MHNSYTLHVFMHVPAQILAFLCCYLSQVQVVWKWQLHLLVGMKHFLMLKAGTSLVTGCYGHNAL